MNWLIGFILISLTFSLCFGIFVCARLIASAKGAYWFYTKAEARRNVKEELANWNLVLPAPEGDNFVKAMGARLVHAYDDGARVMIDIMNTDDKETGFAYRKHIEMLEVAADTDRHAWEKRRQEWMDERERLVKIWRAAKRVMQVTSITPDSPEYELKVALNEMNEMGISS